MKIHPTTCLRSFFQVICEFILPFIFAFSLVAPIVVQAAAQLSPDVMDALDQKTAIYRRLILSKVEESLKSDVFGDLRLVKADPKLDLAKVSDELKKNNALSFSSLPNSISRDQFSMQMIENMKMTQFKTLLKPFQLTVTLSSSLSPQQRALAANVLESALDLPAGSKFGVKFEDLNSAKTSSIMQKTIEEKTELEKQNQKSKEESEKLLRDRDTFARDRDFIAGDKRTLDINLKQEQAKNLALTTEVDKLKLIVDDQKKVIAGKEEELSIYKTPLGDIKKLIKGLELPLTLFPIFIGLFFSLIVIFALLSASQKKRAGMMKEGVELMAATLGKIGGKMGAGNANVAGDIQKLIEREGAEKESLKNSSQQSFAGAGSELLSLEMQNLKCDSESAWKEVLKHPFVMMCILKEWLIEGAAGQERFMSLASTLSPFESAKLVAGFQHTLTKNLKNVVTDVNSRLKGYSYVLTLHRSVQDFLLDHSSACNGIDATTFFAATDVQLTKIIFQKQPQERAELLSLLPAAGWKRILELAADILDADQVAETLAALTSPQNRLNADSLIELVKLVDKSLGALILEEKRDDATSQMTELAVSLDAFSPKLRTAVSLARAKFPRFAQELESRTVTIDHVLRLDSLLLREMLEPLESEQVAQLIASLETQKRSSLVLLLGDKVRLMAEADFQRFLRSPSTLKRAEVEGQKIQSEMVSKLKKLSAEGIVEIPELSQPQILRAGA